MAGSACVQPLLCPSLAVLRPSIQDFVPLPCPARRKNERPDAALANQKWGWIATAPGSWAELEVDTTTEVQVRAG